MTSGAPLLVVSDLHLGRGSAEPMLSDLSALVAHYAEAEWILGGDSFDLSMERHDRELAALGQLLDQHHTFTHLLRSRLARGGQVTLLVGNHDRGLMREGARDLILARLGLNQDARLTLVGWFTRRQLAGVGEVHLEHGHLYDPDNAPLHPLFEWSPVTEPIGIALTRKFVAKYGALHFAHAGETTPLAGIRSAVRQYGAGMPLLFGRYLAAATSVCANALGAKRALALQNAAFDPTAIEAVARAQGLDAQIVGELLSRRPAARHASARSVFMRLYLDRVATAALSGLGVLAFASGLGSPSVALGACAAAYLATSSGLQRSRYGGAVLGATERGAVHIAQLTGAARVVFGHTHVPVARGCYLNAGSFALPQGAEGRPYLWLENAEQLGVRHWLCG